MRSRLEIFFTREWQRRSGWQILLQPLSWIFALLSAIRRALFRAGFFKTYKPNVPVIIIGNINVGGTGKTPLVVALANALAARGRAVGIITRGYAYDGKASDEVSLMSQRSAAPVVANAKRAEAVQQLLSKHPEINTVISDDGMQHYALHRDIEIAVVDGMRGIGNGYLLPAGPLRESAARLESVDCIVVNRTNQNPSTGDGLQPKMPEKARPALYLPFIKNDTLVPVFEMTYGHERFMALAPSIENTIEKQPFSIAAFLQFCMGKRIAAIAGIGNPDRFFVHLESLGFTLNSRHAFPDHHRFQPDDFLKLDADLILMTEKDAVKCMSFANTKMWQMQIDALLPDQFYEFIISKLAEKS